MKIHKENSQIQPLSLLLTVAICCGVGIIFFGLAHILAQGWRQQSTSPWLMLFYLVWPGAFYVLGSLAFSLSSFTPWLMLSLCGCSSWLISKALFRFSFLVPKNLFAAMCFYVLPMLMMMPLFTSPLTEVLQPLTNSSSWVKPDLPSLFATLVILAVPVGISLAFIWWVKHEETIDGSTVISNGDSGISSIPGDSIKEERKNNVMGKVSFTNRCFAELNFRLPALQLENLGNLNLSFFSNGTRKQLSLATTYQKYLENPESLNALFDLLESLVKREASSS
jgi:hypothetical protein